MINSPLHDLICRLLKKKPEDRITLAQIKEHIWITKGGTEPLEDVNVGGFTAPTETELKHAYTKCFRRVVRFRILNEPIKFWVLTADEGVLSSSHVEKSDAARPDVI